MIYKVNEITAAYPALYNQILSEGELDRSCVYIRLPDGFDFGLNPPTPEPEILFLEKHIAQLPVQQTTHAVGFLEPEPQEPTILELAINFKKAMAKWAAAGLPVVTKKQYRARAVVCARCPHWDGLARLGLGKCGHNGCGCTKFKRWLATERCPLNKWSELPKNP